eukprot:Nk52_evm2s2118 gene=Nk52_evmTU2s2118
MMGRSFSDNSPILGKYYLGRTLGEGTYGKVKLGSHVLTGEQVAVKVIERSSIKTPKHMTRLNREIKALKMLDHPNIIKLYDVFDYETKIILVMEYASGGELFDYIVAHKQVKEKEARKFFRQIVSAVDYSHRCGIVHRDLKPENLLLDDKKNIRLVDFGFSNSYDPKKHLETYCGSPYYAAPEMVLGRKYCGPEVDMWSLGVILYALICGCLPFDDSNVKVLYDRIASGVYRTPSHMTKEAKALIKKMLTVDPSKRIRMDQLRKEKWINEGYSSLPEHIQKPEEQKPIVDPEIVEQLVALGYKQQEVEISMLTSDSGYNPIRCMYTLMEERRNRSAGNSSDTTVKDHRQVKPATFPEKAAKPSGVIFGTAELSKPPIVPPKPANLKVKSKPKPGPRSHSHNSACDGEAGVKLTKTEEDLLAIISSGDVKPSESNHLSRTQTLTGNDVQGTRDASDNMSMTITTSSESYRKEIEDLLPSSESIRIQMQRRRMSSKENSDGRSSSEHSERGSNDSGSGSQSCSPGEVHSIVETEERIVNPAVKHSEALTPTFPSQRKSDTAASSSSARRPMTHRPHSMSVSSQAPKISVPANEPSHNIPLSKEDRRKSKSSDSESKKSRRFSFDGAFKIFGGKSKKKEKSKLSRKDEESSQASNECESMAEQNRHHGRRLRTITGWFNVSTTSSKQPDEILEEAKRVLLMNEIHFEEIGYRLVCLDRKIAATGVHSEIVNPITLMESRRQKSKDLLNSLESLDIESNERDAEEAKEASVKTRNSKILSTSLNEDAFSTERPKRESGHQRAKSGSRTMGTDVSQTYLSPLRGGGTAKGAETSPLNKPVRFEFEVCHIPRISLYGLHLKRLGGDIWRYKELCDSLVNQMHL